MHNGGFYSIVICDACLPSSGKVKRMTRSSVQLSIQATCNICHVKSNPSKSYNLKSMKTTTHARARTHKHSQMWFESVCVCMRTCVASCLDL